MFLVLEVLWFRWRSCLVRACRREDTWCPLVCSEFDDCCWCSYMGTVSDYSRIVLEICQVKDHLMSSSMSLTFIFPYTAPPANAYRNTVVQCMCEWDSSKIATTAFNIKATFLLGKKLTLASLTGRYTSEVQTEQLSCFGFGPYMYDISPPPVQSGVFTWGVCV